MNNIIKKILKWILILFAGMLLFFSAGIIFCWPKHQIARITPPPQPVTDALDKETAIEELTNYHLQRLISELVYELQEHPAGFPDDLRTSLINLSMSKPFKDISQWGLCMLGDHEWMREGLFFAMPAVRWMCAPFLFPVDYKHDGSANMQPVMQLIEERAQNGMQVSLDNVGDASLSPENAEDYCRYYHELFQQYNESGISPDLNVSLKLSALVYNLEDWCAASPEKSQLKQEEITQALHNLLVSAHSVTTRTIFVRLDMEEYAYKNKTLETFMDIVERYPDLTVLPDGSLRIGVVIQAYLRDAEDDLKALGEWGKQQHVRIPVRLVKGAYLQHERETAEALGTPSPVWDEKHQTDECFEQLTTYMLTNLQQFKPAIATHNLRSMAHAMAVADYHNISPDDFELQMLFGMGNPIKQILVGNGYSLREYVPAGPLARGLKYAGRRFNELAAKDNALSKTLHGDFSNLYE